jgi:GntR family transcriptional regulator, transcriptional repressor for pyruvate dehydrogenase complex
MIFETANLTNMTVNRLMEMISCSGLKPGEAFAREADLEKELNVSRPVLREAISRLRGLGILESRQCVGLIVSKPDPVELFGKAFQSWVVDSINLVELAEMRYSLEVGAVEIAARRATGEQLARLDELAREFTQHLASKSSARSLDDIEFDFHRTILEATHNSMLIRMHHIIAAYFLRSAREVTGWDVQGSDENSAWEHRAVAKALADRSAERARVILAGHLSHLISHKNPSNQGD